MGVALTRAAIFAAFTSAENALASESVEMPELHGALRVRAFSLGARNAFYAPLWVADEDERRANAKEMDEARLVAFTVVDDEGNLVFTEADIPSIRNWAPGLVDRVAAVARRLNGLGAQAAEQAAKNS